jgi:hypothetical protein
MPCFHSGLVMDNEDQYLTNEGVQPKALKAMLDRLVETKDFEKYDYYAANINEYGWTQKFIEDSWIVTANWSDYLIRGILIASYLFVKRLGELFE